MIVLGDDYDEAVGPSHVGDKFGKFAFDRLAVVVDGEAKIARVNEPSLNFRIVFFELSR